MEEQRKKQTLLRGNAQKRLLFLWKVRGYSALVGPGEAAGAGGEGEVAFDDAEGDQDHFLSPFSVTARLLLSVFYHKSTVFAKKNEEKRSANSTARRLAFPLFV